HFRDDPPFQQLHAVIFRKDARADHAPVLVGGQAVDRGLGPVAGGIREDLGGHHSPPFDRRCARWFATATPMLIPINNTTSAERPPSVHHSTARSGGQSGLRPPRKTRPKASGPPKVAAVIRPSSTNARRLIRAFALMRAYSARRPGPPGARCSGLRATCA